MSMPRALRRSPRRRRDILLRRVAFRLSWSRLRLTHLYGEIDVPWCVDNVDVVSTPRAECSRRLNCDPFFSLKLHRIHFGAHAILRNTKNYV